MADCWALALAPIQTSAKSAFQQTPGQWVMASNLCQCPSQLLLHLLHQLQQQHLQLTSPT
jgi:hypothetical protein